MIEADLILHVRDISHPETEAQRHDVEAVLADLGIAADDAGGPVLEVWNKADRLSAATRTEVGHAMARSERSPVLVSAATGEGIERLRQAIDARLGANDVVLTVEVPAAQGRLLSWLHANAEILKEETAETGAVTARFRIDLASRGKLESELQACRRARGQCRALPGAPDVNTRRGRPGCSGFPKRKDPISVKEMGSVWSVIQTKNHQSRRRRSRSSHVRLTLTALAWRAKDQRSPEQRACNQKAHERGLLGQIPELSVQLFRSKKVHDIDQGSSVVRRIHIQ